MQTIKLIQNFEEAKQEMLKIDVDGGGIPLMSPKMVLKVIKLTDVSRTAATVIKQDMLSIGADVAVAKGTINASIQKTDVLIFGTMSQMRKLIHKLRLQPFGLKKIAQQLDALLTRYHSIPKEWKLKNKTLNFNKPLIMGIVNVTPDSFFDGNKFATTNAAVKHAKQLIKQGADIIDVGGESSRPGSLEVEESEELKRVLPVIKELKNTRVPISIDTYKPNVANACLKAGASIINDISGFKNPEMIKVAKKHNAAVIAMHMQGSPKDMQLSPNYKDVLREVFEYLEDTIINANNFGITKIAIDPGIGFGKTLEHNLQLIKNIKELKSLGCPILLGASRKSFIQDISNIKKDKRLPGTIAANTYALLNGANILRVHDVEETRLTLEIINAIKSV
jgi:dihydropteroate synthase